MKKKSINDIETQEENPFMQSVGDLMAGLLFIFILLLMGTMLQLKDQAEIDRKRAEEDKRIATQYGYVKNEIYVELNREFQNELKSWKADIDSSTLSIKFKEPKMLFDKNQSEIQPEFKTILDQFFPRYMKVLQNSKHRDKIEEIRIEGYADSDGRYMHNMKLSQDRARNVLEYCLEQQRLAYYYSLDTVWTKEHISANGFADSREIKSSTASIDENKAASRRVEFRVKTNAERQLEEILKNRSGK